MSLKEIDRIPLRICQKPLLRKLGRIRNNKSLSARMRKQINKAIKEIRKNSHPKAVFQLFPVNTDKQFVSIGQKTTFKSQKLAKIIEPCKRAGVFLVTLGKEIDKIINNAVEQQPYYGFILDAAASLAIESSAEYVQEYIDRHHTSNNEKTLRYSPGYCGWSITEQKKLFQTLPSDKVNVKLSDSCFMSPQKSISGLIGIGSGEQVYEMENLCTRCHKVECRHRKF